MGIQPATGSTSDRKQTDQPATNYADAVAAMHLPEKERQWRLRNPSLVRPEGKVITLKEEVEYDEARLKQEQMHDRDIAFAIREIGFRDEVSRKCALDVSTHSVQVRTFANKPFSCPT